LSVDNNGMKNYFAFADFFSLLNASFGFLAIIMALQGQLILSAKFMLISVIFDSVDGWVARKTNRVDNLGFGKNMDSLCDAISFGVAPGIFLYSATLTYDIRYINILVSLLIVTCGIMRLSRFNVLSESKSHEDNFVGLPIPTIAVVLASFYLSNFFRMDLAILIMTLVSLLMISTIEYPKIKSIKTALLTLILIAGVLLPQKIQTNLLNIPANVLFSITIVFIVFMPTSAILMNLRRGPHVR